MLHFWKVQDDRQFFFFEADPTRGADGSVTLKPGKVVTECSVKKAAAMLGGVSADTVRRLWHAGLIAGYQPSKPRVSKRRDGRGTNAKLVLCAISVLRYAEAEMARQNRR